MDPMNAAWGHETSTLALLLSAGEHRYALPCRRVKEVISCVELRTMAHAPAWLVGLFNYRGAVAPVVDLRMLVQGEPCSRCLSSRIVVFERSGADGVPFPIGLLAERVTETRRLSVRHTIPASMEGAPYVASIVLEDTGMIGLIDLDKIVTQSLGHMRLFTPAASQAL
jgi:chemotaxis-related protein WspB